ncbi:hypothetical protein [Polynucleobacter sp. JS-JIR-II-b4]|uniref:hypothetical protein n=1 Tax=Polynucleobacter sp. JS-JIR-II-b4 TaxID=1758390 RepID=UPI001BFDF898|nr:hypothetical protein [Polynucleobacter sp. JS-JIR-II-b4]QWE02789.1 hypothetical protein ICV90_01475 [Polynucleobacter sp. JS-JIR-II-b4]
MSLLECLVGIALCALLLNPLLKTSADLVIKQIEFEKKQSLISEADRAFELIGRAIRMAGYRNIQNTQIRSQTSGQKTNAILFLEINKKSGFRGSDALTIRHELSDGVDFDCIGNVLTKDRTKNHLAMQGFLVDRQAGVPKGQKVNGGSLICQSLDRQGRIQNTTLMNGVNGLFIEELNAAQTESMKGQRLFKIKLQMTDGAKLNVDLERTFATRNLL